MMKWFSEEEIRQAISNERVESRIYVEGSRVYLSYERMCEVKSTKRIERGWRGPVVHKDGHQW